MKVIELRKQQQAPREPHRVRREDGRAGLVHDLAVILAEAEIRTAKQRAGLADAA